MSTMPMKRKKTYGKICFFFVGPFRFSLVAAAKRALNYSNIMLVIIICIIINVHRSNLGRSEIVDLFLLFVVRQ